MVSRNFENPYQSPSVKDETLEVEGSASGQPHIVLMAVAILIGAVPLLGFFVHAARQSQDVVFWFLVAWIATLTNIIVCISWSIFRRQNQLAIGRTGFLLILLVLLLVAGWFGIGSAIVELWAG